VVVVCELVCGVQGCVCVLLRVLYLVIVLYANCPVLCSGAGGWFVGLWLCDLRGGVVVCVCVCV
jgi:hypothetical protein